MRWSDSTSPLNLVSRSWGSIRSPRANNQPNVRLVLYESSPGRSMTPGTVGLAQVDDPLCLPHRALDQAGGEPLPSDAPPDALLDRRGKPLAEQPALVGRA